MTLAFIAACLVSIILYIKLVRLSRYHDKNSDFDGEYFKSRQAELLFYLKKLQGKQRNELLGITDEHYENKKLAQKWYREISKFVHPDKQGCTEAFNVLTAIYNILIEDDEAE